MATAHPMCGARRWAPMSEHQTGAARAISVVLYVHNGEPYLTEALDSILAQSHENFELCVVDDGSTDATADILAAVALGDPRVRVQRQAAKGRERLHETFNACLAMAQHDLVAIANADDIWRPEKLERQLIAFDEDPDLDICYHEATFIDADGRVRFGGFRRYSSPYPLSPPRPWQFVAGNPIPNPTVMFHRGIVRRIGLQEVGDMHDHQFWFKAALFGCRFLGLPDRLIRYRLHEASHSTSAVRRGAILEAHRQSTTSMIRTHGIDALVPELALVAPDDTDSRGWAFSFIAGHLWLKGSYECADELWRQALQCSDDPAIVCGLGMAAIQRGERVAALRLLRTSADAGVGQARVILDDSANLEEMIAPVWHGPEPEVSCIVKESDRSGFDFGGVTQPDRYDAVLFSRSGGSDGGLATRLAHDMLALGSVGDAPKRMIALARSSEEVDLIGEAYEVAIEVDAELAEWLAVEIDIVPSGQFDSVVQAHQLDGAVVCTGQEVMVH